MGLCPMGGKQERSAVVEGMVDGVESDLRRWMQSLITLASKREDSWCFSNFAFDAAIHTCSILGFLIVGGVEFRFPIGADFRDICGD
jgi:hypothetical protein